MTCQAVVVSLLCMATIKISSKIEESVWNELKAIAQESHQSVSGLLTEAVDDYVKKRRIRPIVLDHLNRSMADNDELGSLLAR